MWGLPLDAVGLGILLVMLLSLLFALVMQQRQRRQKTVALGLGALVIGGLVGSACTLGALRLLGVRQVVHVVGADYGVPAGFPQSEAYPPDRETEIPTGEGETDRRGRPAGMGGVNPGRELTTLVRKLDLLTGDIAIVLTAEQAVAVTQQLADVETSERLSDEDAQLRIDAVLAQLDEGQKARLDAIGLPRTPRAGLGPAGGPGVEEEADRNLFQQEVPAEALGRLRQRLSP